MSPEHWTKLRGVAVRLLRARGHARAAEILEQVPFKLREGRNVFSDEFAVLYWAAPLDRYVEAAEWRERKSDHAAFEQIARVVGEVATSTYVRFIAVDIDADDGPAAVENPNLTVTTDVVEHALHDAEQLINSTGATSGVDRVHTALHGYLKAVCDDAQLSYPPDPTITKLFRIVRNQHAAFSNLGVHNDAVQRIVMPLASVVDSLNTVRNVGSLAHPNEVLLEEAEAMLVINAARTLLHYLNAKIS